MPTTEAKNLRWEDLKDGQLGVFGFVQVDTTKSSDLKGPEGNIQKTKENLKLFLTNILEAYGARLLDWAGDGGAFAFLIQDPSKDYDDMVIGAIQILLNMPLFNSLKKFNLLNQELCLRISCHVGQAHFHKEAGLMHSKALNYFLKFEREIGRENSVTITEDVYSQLVDDDLKGMFEQTEPHDYSIGGKRYSKALYKTKWWIPFLPRGENDFFAIASRIRKKAAIGGSAGKTLLTFASKHLKSLEETIERLSSKEGIEVDRADLVFITQLCFKMGTSKYDGTDSHTPSEFLKVYPEYLTFHSENLKVNPEVEHGSRILIVDPDRLRRDLDVKSDEYLEFLKWHEDNKVELLVVDPMIASKLKEQYKLPTTDLGIWYGHYALLFEPKEKEGRIKLWLTYPEEDMYRSSVEYFRSLWEKARHITPELFDITLAKNWEGFIDPCRRLELEGKFLEDILEPYKNGLILDAAAGIGVEYSHLLKQGFRVYANEIEETLRCIGENYTRLQKVPWVPLQVRWEHLGDEYPSYWDVILVLGNSLCLVLDRRTRELCIKQFWKALKPGGMLVIDERNFEYIIKNWKKIQSNPIKNFRYSGKVMYCQKTIRGIPYPHGFVKGAITFVYFPKEIDNIDEAWARRVGHLHMYPFRRGELKKLLEDAGFIDIKVYSDLTKVGFDDKADFFTYLAYRPKE